MLGGSSLSLVPGVTPKKQNEPNFDFFNYAGIIRPVKIYSTPKSYIKDATIVPRVDGENAVVSYKIDAVGEGTVSLSVYAECGTLVATADGAEGIFTIENARLWQPLNAYLYTTKITFGEDCYEQTFGVRTIEVKGTQFLINGRPFYFKGLAKHEDSKLSWERY